MTPAVSSHGDDQPGLGSARGGTSGHQVAQPITMTHPSSALLLYFLCGYGHPVIRGDPFLYNVGQAGPEPPCD